MMKLMDMYWDEPSREEDSYGRSYENKNGARGYQSDPMFKPDMYGGNGTNQATRRRRDRKEYEDDKY